jgi:hypothetical protein
LSCCSCAFSGGSKFAVNARGCNPIVIPGNNGSR